MTVTLVIQTSIFWRIKDALLIITLGPQMSIGTGANKGIRSPGCRPQAKGYSGMAMRTWPFKENRLVSVSGKVLPKTFLQP